MKAEERSEQDRFAADLRGFGPLGLVAIAVILLPGNTVRAGSLVLPVSAMLVLAWRAASRTPWREIGYLRPRSWIGDMVLGVDGKMLHLTGKQFAAYIRLNCKVGDRVTYHLLRDGKRLDVMLTLRARATR